MLEKTPFQPRKMLVVVVCCILHNFCRHLPLNEEDLNVQVDDERRDVEDYNESEEGREKRNGYSFPINSIDCNFNTVSCE